MGVVQYNLNEDHYLVPSIALGRTRSYGETESRRFNSPRLKCRPSSPLYIHLQTSIKHLIVLVQAIHPHLSLYIPNSDDRYRSLSNVSLLHRISSLSGNHLLLRLQPDPATRPRRIEPFSLSHTQHSHHPIQLPSSLRDGSVQDGRPLWADVADELIRLSSRRPDDPRKVSVLWQTWRETSGKTSKLPRDLQAMLNELRRYDIRAEALHFAQNARDKAPVWQSKTVDLSAKEENSAAMRHLRKFHGVQTVGDLKRIHHYDSRGCKKHTHCIEAMNAIHGKTNPRFNARFTTPFLEGQNAPDDLDFTQRRKEKAKGDIAAGRPATLDPSFTHTEGLRTALRVFGNKPNPVALPAYRQGAPPDRSKTTIVWTDGSATGIRTPDVRVGYGAWSETEGLTMSARLTSPPLTNNRAELAAAVWALNKAPTSVPLVL